MSMPISGFTAVYNPQMMAMMPIQSFIMMYEAGQGWQFGKRKISEKSNEEIKALTPIMLMEQNNQVRKDALPIIQRAMDEIAPITRHMVTNFAEIVKEFIAGVGDVGSSIFNQSALAQSGSEITRVRLSQGSQQFQRDRELFAGGATSLYQQDLVREKERQNQRAEQDRLSKLRALEIKRTAEAVAKAKGGNILSAPGKRVSNQTLILERNKIIRQIASQAGVLKRTPSTMKKRTTVTRGGSRGRVILIVVTNPQKQHEANKLKTLQSRLKQLLKAIKR